VNETIAIGERTSPDADQPREGHRAANWGKSAEMLALVDAARARGVDVTIEA
jgi:hypothetical protein